MDATAKPSFSYGSRLILMAAYAQANLCDGLRASFILSHWDKFSAFMPPAQVNPNLDHQLSSVSTLNPEP